MVERSGTPSVVLHSSDMRRRMVERIEVVIEDSTPSTQRSRDRFTLELPPRHRPSSTIGLRVPSLARSRSGKHRFRAACTPRFSSLPRKTRPRSVQPTSAIRTDRNEYPRCVRLTAARSISPLTATPRGLNQPGSRQVASTILRWFSRMNRAFHDARPASMPRARGSVRALSSRMEHRRENISDASVASRFSPPSEQSRS